MTWAVTVSATRKRPDHRDGSIFFHFDERVLAWPALALPRQTQGCRLRWQFRFQLGPGISQQACPVRSQARGDAVQQGRMIRGSIEDVGTEDEIERRVCYRFAPGVALGAPAVREMVGGQCLGDVPQGFFGKIAEDDFFGTQLQRGQAGTSAATAEFGDAFASAVGD